MMGRRQAVAVAAVGILGSQAGHLLTFQLLFGSAAQHLQSSGAHAYFPLLAKTALGVVAAIFLAGMFIAQEIAEAMVAGMSVASAPHLLLWGTLGQLPVAAIGAIGLRWLFTQFESAVEDLRAVLAMVSAPTMPDLLTVQVWPAANGNVLLLQPAGGSLHKRGPPTS